MLVKPKASINFMQMSCNYRKVALILVIIGGLNWGLVGVTELFSSRFDLVMWISQSILTNNILADIVYIIVGLSAIVVAVKK